MPFWNCYYHIVWATKNREPIVVSLFEKTIFDAIQAKSKELRCTLLAINGVADHLHVAVCIQPGLAVGTWVGQVKGAASHAVNTTFPDQSPPFRWQEGYSVLTFGEKNLAFVQAYIEHQKQHHAQGTIYTHLERTDEDS